MNFESYDRKVLELALLRAAFAAKVSPLAYLQYAENEIYHGRKRVCGECGFREQLHFDSPRCCHPDSEKILREQAANDGKPLLILKSRNVKVPIPRDVDIPACDNFKFSTKNCGNCQHCVDINFGDFDDSMGVPQWMRPPTKTNCNLTYGPGYVKKKPEDYCPKWKEKESVPWTSQYERADLTAEEREGLDAPGLSRLARQQQRELQRRELEYRFRSGAAIPCGRGLGTVCRDPFCSANRSCQAWRPQSTLPASR